MSTETSYGGAPHPAGEPLKLDVAAHDSSAEPSTIDASRQPSAPISIDRAICRDHISAPSTTDCTAAEPSIEPPTAETSTFGLSGEPCIVEPSAAKPSTSGPYTAESAAAPRPGGQSEKLPRPSAVGTDQGLNHTLILLEDLRALIHGRKSPCDVDVPTQQAIIAVIKGQTSSAGVCRPPDFDLYSVKTGHASSVNTFDYSLRSLMPHLGGPINLTPRRSDERKKPSGTRRIPAKRAAFTPRKPTSLISENVPRFEEEPARSNVERQGDLLFGV